MSKRVRGEHYNAYLNEYMKNRWAVRRLRAVEVLGSVCNNCGSNEELEFDHIDPTTKIASIARASSFSEKRFWDEVSKCQLLCKPCHIDKTVKNKENRRPTSIKVM